MLLITMQHDEGNTFSIVNGPVHTAAELSALQESSIPHHQTLVCLKGNHVSAAPCVAPARGQFPLLVTDPDRWM